MTSENVTGGSAAGPTEWEAREVLKLERWYVVTAGGSPEEVAVCYGTCADTEAHARLIASAPRLKRERDALLAALEVLLVNADVGPDPRMDGMTDCYLVPLDDIDAARQAIAAAEGRGA